MTNNSEPEWTIIRENRLAGIPFDELGSRFELPVMPECVAAFSQLAASPGVSLPDLARPIETDSGIVTELLKFTNSASMAIRATVTTVTQAIQVLGIERSRTLVLSAALRNVVQPQAAGLPLVQFQRECAERAEFARLAALQLRVDPEPSYLAGLLQDLLLPFMMNRHEEVYKQYEGGDTSLHEFERQELGIDHPRLTAKLMHEWGFADHLIVAVLLHHDGEIFFEKPELQKSPALAAYLAGQLPDVLDQAPGGVEAVQALQEAIPTFSFLNVAASVDEARQGVLGEGDYSLCKRLGDQLDRRLSEKRADRRHRSRCFGSYTLEREIGRGGMGSVHLGRHERLLRPAAVKLLDADQIGRDSIELFEREVQLTSQLTSPNTISIFDYGCSPEGVLFYVMEYLEGLNLAEVVEGSGPLPEGRVIQILQQACNSLADAHACELVHRDIKPQNIMLTRRGGQRDFVKVLDFGLADIVGRGHSTETTTVCGTPLYLSPEAVTHPDKLDGRSDLYSLGAVGYYLLTGFPVFPTGGIREVLRQHVHEEPVSPTEMLGSRISCDLEQIILRCLQKRPQDRPQHAEALSASLQKCQSAGTWTSSLADHWWDANAASSAESNSITTARRLSDRGHEEKSLHETLVAATPADDPTLTRMGWSGNLK